MSAKADKVLTKRFPSQESEELIQRSKTWWKSICSRLNYEAVVNDLSNKKTNLEDVDESKDLGLKLSLGDSLKAASMDIMSKYLTKAKGLFLSAVKQNDAEAFFTRLAEEVNNLEFLAIAMSPIDKNAEAPLLKLLQLESIKEVFFLHHTASRRLVTNIFSTLNSDTSTVVSLNISQSKLSEEDGSLIGDFLVDNSTLEILVLAANNLGTTGATAVIQALSKNKTLKLLDLSNNHIFSPIATPLHDQILSGLKIKVLSLASNAIDVVGGTKIINALRIRKLVLTLEYLVDNPKDFAVVSQLKNQKELKKHKKFEDLALEIKQKVIGELVLEENSIQMDNIEKLYSILDCPMATILECETKKRLKWTDHAWELANSEFGARVIMDSVALMLKTKENAVKRVVKDTRERRVNIVEVLLRNKFVNDDIFHAINFICTNCNISPEDKDSLGRPFIEVMRQHENRSIRRWAIEMGALDRKYKFKEAPPLHISTTAEILVVDRISDNKEVIMKVFRRREELQREIFIRKKLQQATPKHNDGYKYNSKQFSNRKGYSMFEEKSSRSASNRSKSNRNNKNKENEKLYNKFIVPIRGSSKKNSQYFYCIFDKADKSLFEVMNTERVAGIDFTHIKNIMRRAAECLHFVNSRGICHGEFKPKSILRMNPEGYEYKLVDFDSSTIHGEEMKGTMAQGYIPPEAAFAKLYLEKKMKNGDYMNEEMLKAAKVIASEKFDVWSYGVVLFEILSGLSVFESIKASDKLASTTSKADLLNWLEISSGQLERVLEIPENKLKTRDVFFARELVRWCLQRKPTDRPTFDQILEHPFFSNAPESKVKLSKNFKTHLFLSHIQSQASGTVKDLYYCSAQLGCSAWLDMKAGQITQQAMYDGVKHTEAFVVCVTKDIFYSMFCLKEFMWALDFEKKMIFLLEVDPRELLFPFDENEFTERFSNDDLLERLALGLGSFDSLLMTGYILRQVEANTNKIATEYGGNTVKYVLKELVYRRIKELLSSQDCIPYRRREYENVAMMNYLLERIGFIPPSDPILDDRDEVANEKVEKIVKKKERRRSFQEESLRRFSASKMSRKAAAAAPPIYKKIRAKKKRKGLSKIEKFRRKKNYLNKQANDFFMLGDAAATELALPETVFTGTIFVLVGGGTMGPKMASSLKGTISHYIDFNNFSTQWIEYGPDEEVAFDTVKEALGRGKITIICCITPNFFSKTMHGPNLTGFERTMQQQKPNSNFPVVMVQDGFFSRGWNAIKKEVGDVYNHFLLDVEFMPYREKSLREYEHFAMVGEVANRINLFCDVYAA